MITDKQLKSAAQEFIDVMLLTTGIEPNKKPVELTPEMNRNDFLKLISEAIPWIEPTDEFTKETMVVIESIKNPKTTEEDEEVKKPSFLKKKQKKVDVEEVMDKIDEGEIINTLEDDINEAEKLKDLKDIALAEPQFKSIRGSLSSYKNVNDLRDEMLWLLEGSKVPTEPPVEQELPMEEEETQEDVAEKIYQQNIGKAPIKTSLIEAIEIPDEDFLLGLGTIATNKLKTAKPFNNLFNINEVTLESIKVNMENNGFDPAFPIVVWKDLVIDGHTRLEAVEQLNIKEVPILRKDFINEYEALEYAIHNQRDRRNLSEAELLKCIAILDKPLPKEEVAKLGGKASKNKDKQEKSEPTHKKTAKTLGIGETKVSDARVVLADPEALEAVESGKKSIHAAAKEIRDKKKQDKPAKNPLVEKKTRVDAIVQILSDYKGSKGILVEDIIVEADELYVSFGGHSSEKETTKVTEIVMQVYKALGMLEKLDEGRISILD